MIGFIMVALANLAASVSILKYKKMTTHNNTTTERILGSKPFLKGMNKPKRHNKCHNHTY